MAERGCPYVLDRQAGIDRGEEVGVSLIPKSAGASRQMASMYFSASKMYSASAIPQSPKALSVVSVYFNEAEAMWNQLITIILVTQLSLPDSLPVPWEANT